MHKSGLDFQVVAIRGALLCAGSNTIEFWTYLNALPKDTKFNIFLPIWAHAECNKLTAKTNTKQVFGEFEKHSAGACIWTSFPKHNKYINILEDAQLLGHLISLAKTALNASGTRLVYTKWSFAPYITFSTTKNIVVYLAKLKSYLLMSATVKYLLQNTMRGAHEISKYYAWCT